MYNNFINGTENDCSLLDDTVITDSVIQSIEVSYNTSKMQILSAVLVLSDLNEEATSESISVLAGITVEQVCHLAARYEVKGLLNRKLLKRKNRLVRGRLYQYTITKNGIDLLDALVGRMENGLNLNLKGQPFKVDWSGFVVLPGLDDDLRNILSEDENKQVIKQ